MYFFNKPDGDDVREKENEPEGVPVPGSREPFQTHHHQGQADHSDKQNLQFIVTY